MTESRDTTLKLADEAGNILQQKISKNQLLYIKGYLAGVKDSGARKEEQKDDETERTEKADRD